MRPAILENSGAISVAPLKNHHESARRTNFRSARDFGPAAACYADFFAAFLVAFLAAALFAAQRFFSASMILCLPSGLRRRRFLATAGGRPARRPGLPRFTGAASDPETSRRAEMARSIALFCSSNCEMMLATSFKKSPLVAGSKFRLDPVD